jgi:hypothetical protein
MLRPFAGFLCSDLLDAKLPVTVAVTSQRLVLLDLSVFSYLAFDDSLPSSAS